MRKLLLIFGAILMSKAALAQKYSLTVNGGGNMSFVPDYPASFMIAEFNPLMPEFYDLNMGNINSITSMSGVTSKSKHKVGFYVDAALERKLQNQWGLSLSLGLNQIAFEHLIQTSNGSAQILKDAFRSFKDNRFLYLSSRFLNVSKSVSKFKLEAGPVLGYLLSKKMNNRYGVMETKDGTTTATLVTDARGDANKFMAGANLGAQYEVAPKLAVKLGGQYYFTSVYKKEGTYVDAYKKSKPLQVSLGLSYRIAAF